MVMYQMLRLKISDPEQALIFTSYHVFWRKIVAKLELYQRVRIEVFSLQYYCLKFLKFESF